MSRTPFAVVLFAVMLVLAVPAFAWSWPWSDPEPAPTPPPPPVEKPVEPSIPETDPALEALESPKMGPFYGLLANGAIAVGIAFQLGVTLWLVLSASHPVQKIMRITAFTTGLLIFFGARALGLSLSGMILLGITQYSPIKFGLLSIVVPSLMGYVVAWYFIRCIKRGDELAIKVMILVSVFIVMQFGDIYLRIIGMGGAGYAKALVPNLAFTIAIGLYTTLKHEFRELKEIRTAKS